LGRESNCLLEDWVPMARAQRHFLPGYAWHITHRCHKKEYLLKFAKDRRRWFYWLFETKKRYGLRVLNYKVTSNHFPLLVLDNKEQMAASKCPRIVEIIDEIPKTATGKVLRRNLRQT